MTRVPKSSAGFTLIELIVVIALIALSVALVGPRMMRSDSSSLRQAEVMVASLLRTARSTAIMSVGDARLVVDWDPTSTTYLRALAVVTENTPGEWVLVAPPTVLPENVAVVPEAPVPVVAGTSWSSGVVTRFEATTSMMMAVPGLSSTTFRYVNFSPTGGSNASNRLVIAVCRQENGSPKFYTSDQIRAFVMRVSGIATVVQDPTSFE